MLISKCLFPGLGSRRMWARMNGRGTGPKRICGQHKENWRGLPYIVPGGNLKAESLSTCEKGPVSKRAMILLRTGCVICHNLHDLFRTAYIIFRAPWKMKMWGFLFEKNFKSPKALLSKLRPGGPLHQQPLTLYMIPRWQGGAQGYKVMAIYQPVRTQFSVFQQQVLQYQLYQL